MSERRTIGMIVGLIFVIIVILAVLVSLNDQNSPSAGTLRYGGNQGELNVNVPPDQQAGTPASNGNSGSSSDGSGERKDTTPPYPPYQYPPDQYPPESRQDQERDDRDVIILSPFQVTEGYQRARSIVLGSQCYAMIGDVREITYYTSLTGTKFIAELLPNKDYTEFQAIVVVKLADSRGRPVYIREYPVTVDLDTNSVTECKGPRIEMGDVMQPPYDHPQYY